jgi:hypothetical protein
MFVCIGFVPDFAGYFRVTIPAVQDGSVSTRKIPIHLFILGHSDINQRSEKGRIIKTRAINPARENDLREGKVKYATAGKFKYPRVSARILPILGCYIAAIALHSECWGTCGFRCKIRPKKNGYRRGPN